MYPDPPIYPSDPWDYARTLWFERYIDDGAYPKLFGTIFVERVLAPMLFNRPTDQTVVDKAITGDLPVIYGYLDAEIGSRSLLMGERFAIADAPVASFFLGMQQVDAAPDPHRWRNLARYLQQQYALPTQCPSDQGGSRGDGGEPALTVAIPVPGGRHETTLRPKKRPF